MIWKRYRVRGKGTSAAGEEGVGAPGCGAGDAPRSGGDGMGFGGAGCDPFGEGCGVPGAASLARVSLQLSEALDAGLPMSAAWETILQRTVDVDSQDLPPELLDLAKDVSFPGIAVVLRETPRIIRWLWESEKQRSEAEVKRKNAEKTRIADYFSARDSTTHAAKEPLTVRWWKRRGAHGQRSAQSAKMFAHALEFTRIMGSSPAQVLRTLSASIDEENGLEQQRLVSQSGPQLSRRILTTLPLMGMLGAYILGINPVDFFFRSTAGHIVGVLGLLFSVSGFVWMKRMVTKTIRARTRRYDAPLALDLAAAALSSGSSIPDLMTGVGASFIVPQLCAASSHLLEGKTWWDAWSEVPVEFLPLASALENSWTGGALAAETLRMQAHRQRKEEAAILAGEAQKLGIRLLIPLGLTQLPAFILLGIVPVIAHIANGAL